MNCEGADFFPKILNCHFPATDGAFADDIIVATTIALTGMLCDTPSHGPPILIFKFRLWMGRSG